MAQSLANAFFILTQAFTGNVPFHPYSPPAAMLAILGAKRPERPTNPNLTDELWELMEHCWNQDPHLRPEMSVVLGILHGSSVLLSSQGPVTHSPDPCAATPLSMEFFQVTGPCSLPVH